MTVPRQRRTEGRNEADVHLIGNLNAELSHESNQILIPFLRDIAEHCFVKFMVFVYGNVSEAGHSDKRISQFFGNNLLFLHETESVPTALGHPQPSLSNYIHGKVYACLAGPFDIQGQR